MNSQAQSHYEQSLAFFNQGEDKKALDEIDQALSLDPDRAAYRILRARVCLEMHKTAQAIQELEAVIQQGEQVAEAHFQLGCVYDFTRDLEEAASQFTQAIQHDPEMVEGYRRRALSHLLLEQYEAAIQDCNFILQRQPQDGLSYIRRGRAHYRSGDHLTAISDFVQGLYYKSRMSATILWSLAKWRVIPELDAIIAQEPDNADAYFLRGHAYDTYRVAAELPEAIRDYTRAIELSPDRPVFHLFRSQAYLKQGDLDAALQDIDHALARDPAHVDALVLRGRIYYRQEKKHQAMRDWQDALEQCPDRVKAVEIRQMMKTASESTD
ncbi:MAG: tetratricopeptide repeat protein [Anaerolineae bacterium]|nr:tetratricopeptide repeat protein [Anaerolineae bacterium]